MKALSLWQPWATLVAIGAKQNETRSWRTAYRGPLLIHAANREDRDSIALCFRDPFRSALAGAGIERARDMPFGAIVAVCNLHCCVPVEKLLMLPKNERAFGDYSNGRFAWLLKDVQQLDPIPYRGSQGLFDVPDDAVEAAIVAADR